MADEPQPDGGDRLGISRRRGERWGDFAARVGEAFGLVLLLLLGTYVLGSLTPSQGWTGGTPLWIYVLKEAEALHQGDRLGPVGGRIVGEVLIGIIDADPESFRSVDRRWKPTLPAYEPESFGIADILVPPEE